MVKRKTDGVRPNDLPFTIYHLRLLYLPEEPRLRHAPLALDGGGADAQDFRRLLDREAAEEAQLDDARLLRVERVEAFERLVERDQVRGALARHVDVLVEREFLEFAAALFGLLLARVIDEDAAHHLRRDAEEVRPVLPLHLRLIDEPQVGFVDERGRLQGVALSLAAQVAGRLA